MAPTWSTTTTHKTLGGPRAGIILCKEEYAKKIDSAVFPGQQGGPLEHVIAGKAVALKIAKSELFAERQGRTVAGAQAVAEALMNPRPSNRRERPQRPGRCWPPPTPSPLLEASTYSPAAPTGISAPSICARSSPS